MIGLIFLVHGSSPIVDSPQFNRVIKLIIRSFPSWSVFQKLFRSKRDARFARPISFDLRLETKLTGPNVYICIYRNVFRVYSIEISPKLSSQQTSTQCLLRLPRKRAETSMIRWIVNWSQSINTRYSNYPESQSMSQNLGIFCNVKNCFIINSARKWRNNFLRIHISPLL